jgi:hypothetical protein
VNLNWFSSNQSFSSAPFLPNIAWIEQKKKSFYEFHTGSTSASCKPPRTKCGQRPDVAAELLAAASISSATDSKE